MPMRDYDRDSCWFYTWVIVREVIRWLGAFIILAALLYALFDYTPS